LKKREEQELNERYLSAVSIIELPPERQDNPRASGATPFFKGELPGHRWKGTNIFLKERV
jgi:hypothetical protein